MGKSKRVEKGSCIRRVKASATEHIPLVKSPRTALKIEGHALTNRVNTSLTPVGKTVAVLDLGGTAYVSLGTITND